MVTEFSMFFTIREDDVAAELAALSLQQKAGEENDDINGEVEEVMKQQKPKKKDKVWG